MASIRRSLYGPTLQQPAPSTAPVDPAVALGYPPGTPVDANGQLIGFPGIGAEAGAGAGAFAGGDRSARSIISGTLAEFGLGALADWAWGLYLQGAPIEEIMLEVRKRPEYAARFPGMAALVQAGQAITEHEYIQLERTYTDVFRMAGLSQGFYDTPDDFGRLIAARKSPAEVQRALQEGFLRVARAPVEVRQWFGQQFGPAEGDAALAMVFLDPQKALPALERMAAQAVIGGMGRRFNLELDAARAGELADFGFRDVSEVSERFDRVTQLRSLFNETLTERRDLTAEREGVDAAFGVGLGARALEQRLADRIADFSGSSGFTLGRSGSGVGVAR